MVERTRIEVVTPSMSTRCTPAELTLHPAVRHATLQIWQENQSDFAMPFTYQVLK